MKVESDGRNVIDLSIARAERDQSRSNVFLTVTMGLGLCASLAVIGTALELDGSKSEAVSQIAFVSPDLDAAAAGAPLPPHSVYRERGGLRVLETAFCGEKFTGSPNTDLDPVNVKLDTKGVKTKDLIGVTLQVGDRVGLLDIQPANYLGQYVHGSAGFLSSSMNKLSPFSKQITLKAGETHIFEALPVFITGASDVVPDGVSLTRVEITNPCPSSKA